MADTESSIDSPNGNYYPQDFSLEDVEIVTDYGQKFNVRSMVVELSFFEDLYSFITSGYIILKDAVGIVEKFKLDGNEFINITYGKTKTQSKQGKLDRTFRIYKIADRNPVGNLNAEHFKLYFCNEILLLSEQTKISKSYPGKKIATRGGSDGIINDILINKLKVTPDKIYDVEETYGVYDFVIPRLKPLEAISWLSTYARPTGGKEGSDMLFFETKDGFNFKSLQSLLKSEPYGTYKYQPKNLDFDKNSVSEGFMSVLDYEIIKTFDTLEGTSSGVFANKVISIDPLTKSFKTTTFNYDNYSQKVGGNEVIAASTNRLGVKQTQAYDSNMKVVFGNSNQIDTGYIKDRQGSTAKDIFIETFLPNRTAQIALANYTVLKLSIPGDSAMTVGKTINFNLYSLQIDQTRKLDDYFSGKYLVTAVRHVIQTQGVYQTIIEVAKESTNVSYITPNATTTGYKEVING